jgi:hypothetical protein
VDLGPPANKYGWDSGDEHGPDPVRALPERLSAFSVFESKIGFVRSFVWARRALNGGFRPGQWGNVHFRDKGPLGPRLSAAALHIAYGNKTVPYRGPEAAKAVLGRGAAEAMAVASSCHSLGPPGTVC